MKLFEDDWGDKTQEPVEDNGVYTTYLYYNKKEMEQFKAELKLAMRRMFKDPVKDGNISDTVLNLLREYNEQD